MSILNIKYNIWVHKTREVVMPCGVTYIHSKIALYKLIKSSIVTPRNHQRKKNIYLCIYVTEASE